LCSGFLNEKKKQTNYCHPERSEGSYTPDTSPTYRFYKILRYAQNDRKAIV
jgi:hypothetical protein